MKNSIKKNIMSSVILILADINFCLVYYYIYKVLRQVNIYSYVFLFNSESGGTGPEMIIDGIITCLPLFISLIILFIIPISKFTKKDIKIKSKTIYPTIFYKSKIIYSVAILLISLLVLFKVVNVLDYYNNMSETSYIYETYYKDTNEVKIDFPNKKKNLILLYLESMESSLFSKENGGYFEESRIKELETLASENLNFSNTETLGGGYNLTGTSWTIAAAVGSTSGTPLLAEIKNNYNKITKFMPKVRALGDVLESAGYNQELIQGSLAKFAGVDKYYKTHGNQKIFDYQSAIDKGYIEKDYFEWWGFEDKKLFEYAKDEILELSKVDKPFAVSIFTMDTHFKDGYLDESCSEPFEDQLSNVYACSSKMVNDFIEWIKEQDFYENTTVVVIGDHLTMQGGYYKNEDYNRTIYNAFLNSSITTNNNKNREFSALDLYPTILASIGANIEGDELGFGVNLFSNKQTLIEELGYDKFNLELSKSSSYYRDNIF